MCLDLLQRRCQNYWRSFAISARVFCFPETKIIAGEHESEFLLKPRCGGVFRKHFRECSQVFCSAIRRHKKRRCLFVMKKESARIARFFIPRKSNFTFTK